MVYGNNFDEFIPCIIKNMSRMKNNYTKFIACVYMVLCLFLQHFVCARCEKPFLGTRHYEKKGLAYCETHYHQVRLYQCTLHCGTYNTRLQDLTMSNLSVCTLKLLLQQKCRGRLTIRRIFKIIIHAPFIQKKACNKHVILKISLKVGF